MWGPLPTKLSLLENLLRSWAQSTDVVCVELFLVDNETLNFGSISIPFVRRVYMNYRYSENQQNRNEENEEQVFGT